MDIQKKLIEIIPPNQTQYRREFYNTSIIDALTDSEKIEIEDGLIEMLFATPDDTLIIQSLSYMNSLKAIPAMQNSLEESQDNLQRIIISSFMFQIYPDKKLAEIALKAFKKLSDNWDLIICFSYLQIFKDSDINSMIERYVNHKEFLVAYNAKRALRLID